MWRVPVSLLSLLRCPKDHTQYVVESEESSASISRGLLRCQSCDQTYTIVNGIVRMLDHKSLDKENYLEMRLRDDEAKAHSAIEVDLSETSVSSRLEFQPHIKAMKMDRDCTVLELGCGRGRFTVTFAAKCSIVLAVDFSIESLEYLACRLGPCSNVVLVQADIKRLSVAPGRFDRVFSTTSLDSREERLAMHHVASDALTDQGLYVFSCEHYDLRSRLSGYPKTMRYTPGGIFCSRFTGDELEREVAPYFWRAKSRPIQIVITSFWPVFFGRLAEWLPIIRSLGNLILVVASSPLRPPTSP